MYVVCLAAQSEHFKALFFSGMKDSGLNHYTIKDVSSEAFLQFLEFIYTGGINIQDMSFELQVELLSCVVCVMYL